MVMSTDPNWLYSTIAQSSAAIVAIIGGFITSTILKLAAEKGSLIKRLQWLNSYIKSDLAPLTENIEERKNEILNLETSIKTFSYPPNLKWGLVVMGFFTFFGIMIPVLIIASEAFFFWTKLLTVITFCIGLIGLITYIVLQIRTLKKR